MTHKKCTFCNELKLIDNFFVDRQKKDGYRPRCKVCEKKYNRDKEGRKKYEKEYWDKRRDDKRKIVLKSYYGNSEKHKKKRKEYLDSDRGKEKQKIYWQNRYARMKDAYVEYVDIRELYNEYGGVCFYCNKELTFNSFHVDHYIPLSKGGKHEKSNLRISCPHCNLSKGAKLPKEG